MGGFDLPPQSQLLPPPMSPNGRNPLDENDVYSTNCPPVTLTRIDRQIDK